MRTIELIKGLEVFGPVTEEQEEILSPEALEFLVESIKQKAPVFGKELFEDQTYTWKKNT